MAQESKSESAEKAVEKQLHPQQVQAMLRQGQQQIQTLQRRKADLEVEKQEHELVMKTLSEVDKSRRCFRMVGGVLIEKTAGEALPQLKANAENIGNVIGVLNQQVEAVEKKVRELQLKHHVKGGPPRASEAAARMALSSGSAGVLA